MFRLRTLVLAVAAVATACTSADKSSVLTLNVDGPRTLTLGAVAKLKLYGRTVAGDTTTPAKGVQVTLTVGAGLGTVDPTTATLGDDGRADVTFTACKEGQCDGKTPAVVGATATIDGKPLTTNATFTLTTGATCPATVDCANAACADKICSTTATVPMPGKCGKLKTCETDTVGNTTYDLGLVMRNLDGSVRTAARAPAGGDPFALVATLTTKDGKPAGDLELVFKIEKPIGKLGKTADEAGTSLSETVTVKTDAATGVATAYFTPAATPANGKIIITQGTDLRLETPFDTVDPGTLTFVQPDDKAFGIMGVKTSGYREQQLLKFKLLDSSGEPYAGHATVTFKLVTTGGASFAPEQADIDGNGEVAVTVYSGTSAGTLAVAATTQIGSKVISTTSPSIAVVGAKANGRNLAVRCEVVAIPGLIGNDCSFMRADEDVQCTAVAGDRFNNLLGVGGHVTWHTEGALFGPPSSFPPADPTAEPSGQANLGRTSNTLRTLNARMPRDVEPMTSAGETKVTADDTDPCVAPDGLKRVYNPRDGLNTFIVTTQGEEGFYDTNGNGKYDPPDTSTSFAGEEFIDLGEPFIDANDNNQFDADEVFIDSDKNGVFGVYDGPNGKWDSDTTIWATGHLMITGGGERAVYVTPQLAVAPKSSTRWEVIWQDQNFNDPAPTFTTYSTAIIGAGTMLQTSPDKYADHFGSLGIAQVTRCDAATRICRMETHIGFSSVPGAPQFGSYKAPDVAPDSADILPTCSVTGRHGGVIYRADIPVTVTDSPSPP